jgi:hypothetical protein
MAVMEDQSRHGAVRDPQRTFNIVEASRMLTRPDACPIHERGRAGQSL